MIRVMNYAYYMLYSLLGFANKILAYFNYMLIYPLASMLRNASTLKESRNQQIQQIKDGSSASVIFFTASVFYIGYVILNLDVFVFLYAFGVDTIKDVAPYGTIDLIIFIAILFPWSWPLHRYCVDKRKDDFFDEFSKYTFEQHLKYSIYGILYYLFPLILLATSSYLAYHRWLSLGGS